MRYFVLILILFLCSCDDTITCDDETACGESNNGSCLYNDCNGDCDGGAVIDECGVCSGGTSDHDINSDKDECGVCGGDGIADGACDCDGNVDLGCGCGEPAAEDNYDCDGNCLNDTDGDGTCDELESCPGDYNEDGLIQLTDLLDFLVTYGNYCDGCPQDSNGDGLIQLTDLLNFLILYGNSCE